VSTPDAAGSFTVTEKFQAGTCGPARPERGRPRVSEHSISIRHPVPDEPAAHPYPGNPATGIQDQKDTQLPRVGTRGLARPERGQPRVSERFLSFPKLSEASLGTSLLLKPRFPVDRVAL